MTSDPRLLCLCFLLGTASPAMAQDLVGGGLAIVPKYPGSDEYRVMPAPIVNFQRGPFFISSTQGLPGIGLKTQVAPDLDVGIRLGFGMGRKENRGPLLEGLGEIDRHAQYGVFAEWKPGPWSLSVTYNQAAKSGYGGTLGLNGSYALWQGNAHQLRLGARVEWGNRDNMQTWFGITSEQAARSRAGLPVYQPSSGMRSAAAYAMWTYRLNERWGVIGLVGVSTLTGDAADSPIVERKTAGFGSLGLSYAF